MAGHLAEKQIEKPRVNVRQALLDAGEAAAKREAWDAFLIEWNKRNQAQDVPESEMFQ